MLWSYPHTTMWLTYSLMRNCSSRTLTTLLTRLDPTMPANRARVNMPATIIAAPTRRPSPVTGAMSPNPTVVVVTSAHHMPSRSVVMSGLSLTSTRYMLVPPSSVATPRTPNARANSTPFSSNACKTMANGLR